MKTTVDDSEVYAVQQFLCGRMWHERLLPFTISTIEKSKKYQFIKMIDGQYTKSGQWICPRCVCADRQFYAQFNCAKCHKQCTYCRKCIQMGRVASCDVIVTWCGPDVQYNGDIVMNWSGKLTKAQAEVAQQLVASVQQKKPRLVHAVCGAGKTEILFSAIYEALIRGDRVCVATPRTDVVLELLPRMQHVFPTIPIQALYGGAELKVTYAPLILATTHQLYRFYEAFDIIFVDEADAFPYTYDASLQVAVQKAVKRDGAVMLVTATPSAKMMRQFQQHDAYSFIPRRFHGFDLPVPRFQALWFYAQQLRFERLPKKLGRWIAKCEAAQKPYLIFFPTIELMKKSAPLFSVPFVYAEAPDRKEKVMQLREGKLKGLLTTTILERGITIPSLQVAVIGAESPIFTASALIQISGRVGRSAHDPTGDIVFFHHGITDDMDEARREILRLNRM